MSPFPSHPITLYTLSLSSYYTLYLSVSPFPSHPITLYTLSLSPFPSHPITLYTFPCHPITLYTFPCHIFLVILLHFIPLPCHPFPVTVAVFMTVLSTGRFGLKKSMNIRMCTMYIELTLLRSKRILDPIFTYLYIPPFH